MILLKGENGYGSPRPDLHVKPYPERHVRSHADSTSRPATFARKVTPRTAAQRPFCALRTVAEQWLKGAAAAGNTRLGPDVDQLAGLAAAHGTDTLLAALTRAVAFGPC